MVQSKSCMQFLTLHVSNENGKKPIFQDLKSKVTNVTFLYAETWKEVERSFRTKHNWGKNLLLRCQHLLLLEE